MKYITLITGCAVALSLSGCAHRSAKAGAQGSPTAEYVGSTPGHPRVQEFLGGLATNAMCDFITWSVTLSTNRSTGRPSTFDLAALYHVPKPGNTNHSMDGPKVAMRGTWEILKGTPSRPDAVVYRMTAEKTRHSLSFVQVGDGLLHLLNPDGSLVIGTAGYSFNLNRSDRAEKPGDRDMAMSAPSMSYKISALSTGATVFAVFEGRTPCLGISREMNVARSAACIKAKWRVTLYQNPETSAPTTYKVEGSLFRDGAREGTWGITQGAKTDPKATVYQLNATPSQPALLFLKGDDNVLFFLKADREMLIGHADFSYTLNRRATK